MEQISDFFNINLCPPIVLNDLPVKEVNRTLFVKGINFTRLKLQ